MVLVKLKSCHDLNLNYFTYDSKTDLNFILIGSRNVELITSHPQSSFQFTKIKNNVIDSLIILQKESFGKIVSSVTEVK